MTRFRCSALFNSSEQCVEASLSWQLDSDGFPMTIQKPMTLQEAKSIARHLGLTLRKVRSGDYRVNFRDGDETRLITRTISKTPSIARLRWPVSEIVSAVPCRVGA
jgi:hypothetical protein